MRKKEPIPSVVVTFHTTAEAMATEALCRKNQLPGKLISAPRAFSADCGIAWCGPSETEPVLCNLLRDNGINVHGIHQMDL